MSQAPVMNSARVKLSSFQDYVKIVHLKSKQLVMNSTRIKVALVLWKSQTKQTNSHPKLIFQTSTYHYY